MQFEWNWWFGQNGSEQPKSISFPRVFTIPMWWTCILSFWAIVHDFTDDVSNGMLRGGKGILVMGMIIDTSDGHWWILNSTMGLKVVEWKQMSSLGLGQNNPYSGTLEAGMQSSNKEPMYGLVCLPCNLVSRWFARKGHGVAPLGEAIISSLEWWLARVLSFRSHKCYEW